MGSAVVLCIGVCWPQVDGAVTVKSLEKVVSTPETAVNPWMPHPGFVLSVYSV